MPQPPDKRANLAEQALVGLRPTVWGELYTVMLAGKDAIRTGGACRWQFHKLIPKLLAEGHFLFRPFGLTHLAHQFSLGFVPRFCLFLPSAQDGRCNSCGSLGVGQGGSLNDEVSDLLHEGQ